ncbi:MAG: hypothetical protein AAGC72_16870 [Planctomycetota bacterium]
MLTQTAIAASAHKFTPWAASIATALGTRVDVTPLPAWAEAGVLGIAILALGYTVRHLFNLREQERKKYIERLEQEIKEFHNEIDNSDE